MQLKVIISDATVPGEGEHKIMEFIRSQRSSPEHDPNTRHVIYGLVGAPSPPPPGPNLRTWLNADGFQDADLIMLGLATHEPHFRVLREDVFFQEAKARTCRICGQKGHLADRCRGEVKRKEGAFGEKDSAQPLKPFIWLHVSVLREYLEAELYVPSQPFRFDLERALDDWVFMCFFVGNDFLPHLPSLDIRDNGIDTLMAIWKDNIPNMGGYVTKDGVVDLGRTQMILQGLAKQEDAIFRRRRQVDERREANAKRRKLGESDRSHGRLQPEIASGGPGGRRNSPEYGTPVENTKRKGRHASFNGPPADLPIFAPNNITEEAKKITHEMVVNRAAIYKANQSNKSAAAVLKGKLFGQATVVKTEADSTVATMESVADETAAEHQEVNRDGPDDQNVSKDQDHDPSPRTPASALGKRKAELIDEDGASTPGVETPSLVETPAAPDQEGAPDTVRLWEEGYGDRYYEQKFGVDAKDLAFRHKVAHAYVEGLAWVLLYYFQGCPSWTWYYPYHYAPFAADFVDLEELDIKFDKGIPFRPFEQLMGVLPAASRHAIPEIFHGLMTDSSSDIIDFYPEDFPIDLNGKKFAWQGVALLPFIDEKRLLKAMAEQYPRLSTEEASRNEVGRDVLFVSDGHPFYDEVATNFYSKKQGSPKYKLNPRVTEGLAGKVEKIESQLPRGALHYPLANGGMPDLDDNRSIRQVFQHGLILFLRSSRKKLTQHDSVYYDFPRVDHMHKSMLLRGVKFPPPALDRADIEETKNRAGRNGRSYGGAPFRPENGRGRGRMDYSARPPLPLPPPHYAAPPYSMPPAFREGPFAPPYGPPTGYQTPSWPRQPDGQAWVPYQAPPPYGHGPPAPGPPTPFSHGYPAPMGNYRPPPPPPPSYDPPDTYHHTTQPDNAYDHGAPRNENGHGRGSQHSRGPGRTGPRHPQRGRHPSSRG